MSNSELLLWSCSAASGEAIPIGGCDPCDVARFVVPGGIKQLAAGRDHALLLASDGTLLGVGRSENGQLGERSTGSQPNTGSQRGSLAATCSPGASSSTPVPILRPLFSSTPPGLQVRQVACGMGHSLLLCGAGEVLVSGENNHGQLGMGHTAAIHCFSRGQHLCSSDGVASVACGPHASYAVSHDKLSLVALGCNSHGQLGDGNTSYATLWPVRVTSKNWDGPVAMQEPDLPADSEQGVARLASDHERKQAGVKRIASVSCVAFPTDHRTTRDSSGCLDQGRSPKRRA